MGKTNPKMNVGVKQQTDIIKEISKDTGFKIKDLKEVFDSFEKVFTSAIADGYEIALFKNGKVKFVPRIQPQISGRNVHTGERLVIPPHKYISFEPSVNWKEGVGWSTKQPVDIDLYQ